MQAHRRARIVSAILIVCVLLGGSGAAHARQDGGARSGAEVLRELRAAYDETVAEEARLVAEYDLLLAGRAIYATELDELDAAIEYVTDVLAEARRQLADAEEALETAEEELLEAEARLAAEIQRLKDQAISAFVGDGSAEAAVTDAYFGSASAAEATAVLEYSNTVVERQTATVLTVEELEAAAEELREERADREDEARQLHGEVEAYEGELETNRAEVEVLQFYLGLTIGEQESLIEEVQSRRAEYEDRLNALERDSDGVAAVLQEWQAGDEVLPIPTLLMPVPGASVTSGFGPRVHPIFGDLRNHNGLDITGSTGTPIRAAADGTVVMATSRQGFGNVTVIDHGGQVATVYAHQSEFLVEFGQEVRRGQIIGLVGSTGYSTGPHLHLELRVFGAPTDALPYLDMTEPVPCDVLVDSPYQTDQTLLAEARDLQRC